MTENKLNPDDEAAFEQWLAALKGRPNSSADPTLNREAAAMRAALKARTDAIAASTAPPNDIDLHRLFAKLRTAGLIRRTPVWQQPRSWALAASVTLALALGVQLSQPLPSSGDVTRGLPATIFAKQPSQVTDELVTALRATGTPATNYELCNRTLELSTDMSPAALAALAERAPELSPDIRGDQIFVKVSPLESVPCSTLGRLRDRWHRVAQNLHYRLWQVQAAFH